MNMKSLSPSNKSNIIRNKVPERVIPATLSILSINQHTLSGKKFLLHSVQSLHHFINLSPTDYSSAIPCFFERRGEKRCFLAHLWQGFSDHPVIFPSSEAFRCRYPCLLCF